jgi:hypothetical protein
MSKCITFLAGIVLAAGMTLAAPGRAQAFWGWGPYLYYGWPYDRYSFTLPRPYYYAPSYYAPSDYAPRYYAPADYEPRYYAPPPRCGWVRVRGWQHGHRVWRRVWGCR